MPYSLTRLLYATDEVMLSLLNELLIQKDVEACLFWVGELYYSKVENLYDFIWKIYFDFYAEYNPHLEKYIQKKQMLWNSEKNIKHIICIIYNMFYMKSSSTTFLLRLHIVESNNKLKIYRSSLNKKWNWLKSYPKCYYGLLKSLHKNDLLNSALFLNKLIKSEDPYNIYLIIIDYYVDKIELLQKEIIEEKWQKRGWYNDLHGLLSLIVHLQCPRENICHPLVFKIPSTKLIEFIEKTNTTIEEKHKKNEQVYHILKHFRIYKINDMLCPFHLQRNYVEDLYNEMNYYWEYYANNCPLWRERFHTNGGMFDDKHLILNDDYKINYNLEFDEQAFDIKYKSTCLFKKLSFDDWHRKIFKVTPHIVLSKKIVY